MDNVRALQALRRLEERYDAGPAIYEPRYLDAEKAVAEAHGEIYTNMHVCLVYFESYRVLRNLATQKEIYKCVAEVEKKMGL